MLGQYTHVKKKKDHNSGPLPLYIKIDPKSIRDPNLKAKITKRLEENFSHLRSSSFPK